MSQPDHQYLANGVYPADASGHLDQLQFVGNQTSQPLQGRSNFGDSSGSLFSVYSEIAENEDNKMTDRWQKDADGILIFTGLFSAAVASLLAVSVQDLRPNPQDISAFYLANIYQIFADPNATLPRTAIPSTLAVPPPFSPPRYAVWVNSLWFLSLVISLTCAAFATSLNQWARRYIRFTQPARSRPEKRARMRAFFADGVEKMHLPLAVETLPALIHLSLFLFFAGLAIFLFNINHSTFTSVIWWIGLFSTVYGWITMMPIFRHDSPYYTPLSSTVWTLHALVLYTLFTVLTFITSGNYGSMQTLRRFGTFRNRYSAWMVGGVLKGAEETASQQSSDIDLSVLDWTIGTLGEDDTLERFFEAIPGFFNSQVVKDLKTHLPSAFRSQFVDSICGLLARNFLSNSTSEAVKTRRLLVSMNAADALCDSDDIYRILSHLSRLHFDQVPQSIQTAQILARWCRGNDDYISRRARQIVASILLSVPDRDDRWIAFVKDKFGLPEHILRDSIAHDDDSVLLSIFIHVARQVIHTNPSNLDILWSLAKFDIRNTVPGLQNEFCALWNEIVLQARSEFYPHVFALSWIRHLYIALHQGTDAAPTAFSASTTYGDPILAQPSSYPLCNIAAHHPDLSTHDHALASPAILPPARLDGGSLHPENQPILGGNTASKQAEEVDIIRGLPSSTDLTLPLPKPVPGGRTDTSELPDISRCNTSVSFLSPLATNNQPDITASHAVLHITQISSTANHTPQSKSNIGATLQTSEESSGILPTAGPGSLSSLVLLPALHRDGNAIPMVCPSSEESTLVQPDSISQPFGSLTSSVSTASSHITPQAFSVLDSHIATNDGSFSTQNNSGCLVRSTPMRAFHHASQAAPSTMASDDHTPASRDNQAD